MNIFKAILFLILYLICLEFIGLWLIIPERFGIRVYSFHFFVSGIIFLTIMILFIRLVRGKDYKIPQKTESKWYYLAILIGLLYVPIQDLINIPYDYFLNENTQIIYDFNGFQDLIKINSLGTIILFPICEELFFREYILNNLRKRYSFLFSLIFSSFLFSIMHFPYTEMYFDLEYSFNQTYIAFFGGLFLGFLYLKSKSIGPPIIMHICWNFLAILI